MQLTTYEDSLEGYLEMQNYLRAQHRDGYRFVSWLVTPSKKILVLTARHRATTSDSNFFEDVAP